MAVFIRRLAAVVLLLCGGTAYAFKIDTHLWLADHLLAEIGQGHVRFEGGVSIPLHPRVAESISRYPGAFRIGVLGADLYPDLIAGQMTTHPGLPPLLTAGPDSVPTDVATLAAVMGRSFTDGVAGWQTDDWLAHVLEAAWSGRPGATPEIAFAFGYLLHAAMDTWAHSYVNVYTGDLFSIVENQEIAARHTVMETFIREAHAPYAAPLVAARRPRGEPAKPGERLSRRVPVDNLAQQAAPARFVRETLILNAEAAGQYAHTPGAQHVYAMWLVWDAAMRARSEWQQIRQGLDQLLDRAGTAVFEADQVWEAADQAKRGAEAAAALALTAKGNAEQAAVVAGGNFATMVGDVLDALASSGVAEATEATLEGFLGYLPPPMRTAYFQAKAAAQNADKALQDAVDAYETASQHSQDMADELLDAAAELDLKRAAEQAAQDARRELWRAADLGLDGWRRNIESAVDAYVRAFEETAREIMRDSGNRFRKGANVTWPLKEWAACWGPLFGMPAMPLPPALAAETCQAGLSAYSHARQNLTLLKNNAPFDLLGLPGLKQQIIDFEEGLHERVRDGMPLAGQMVADGLGPLSDQAPVQLVPGTASFMAAMWDKHPSPDDLNAEFAQDGSDANLPVYPTSGPHSVAEMLYADGLPRAPAQSVAGLLDFEPVHNAVQMSRLALLDGDGLNALVTQFGIEDSAYPDGQPAYPAGAPAGAALLGAIRSIDGNHQWQPVAPPLPRRVFGVRGKNVADAECRRFGYPANGYYGAGSCEKDDAAGASPHVSGWLEGKRGFRLWLDPVMRREVFEALFTGPLSEAVCDRLGSAAGDYPGLGCLAEELYPPSESSAQSVASFLPLEPQPVLTLPRAPSRKAPAVPARQAPPSQPARSLPAAGARVPGVTTGASEAGEGRAPAAAKAPPDPSDAAKQAAPVDRRWPVTRQPESAAQEDPKRLEERRTDPRRR